ncbi:TetR/AcrR family transcriptional regulator [Sphingomonas sp. RB3P16]|uniref:TetR/AcrR family transcriptional regulator n=1 Tax=Parasphingomonas frigoris TaxID=3096163 RepID=UPI002FC93330
MVPQRLTRQDWLDAALTSLAQQGYQSLRAERLAKALGVSRGSFYWHFADVETFEQAVLDHWETVAVDTPYADAIATARRDSSMALEALIRRVFRSPVALERAVRSWAATSQIAAAALRRVDQRRLSILTELIASGEARSELANVRAILLYWTYIGHVTNADITVDEAIVTALIEHFCDIRPGGSGTH